MFWGTLWQVEFMNPDVNKVLASDVVNRRVQKLERRIMGYQRYYVPMSDGSRSVRFIYTSEYYEYDQSPAAWKRYKYIYPILVLISIASSVAALCIASDFTLAKLPSAFEVLTLIAAAVCGFYLIYQLAAPRRMTVYQHRMAVKIFSRWVTAASALSIITALIMAVYAFRGTAELHGITLSHYFIRLISAASSTALFVLERFRTIKVTENNDPFPPGAQAIE